MGWFWVIKEIRVENHSILVLGSLKLTCGKCFFQVSEIEIYACAKISAVATVKPCNPGKQEYDRIQSFPCI